MSSVQTCEARSSEPVDQPKNQTIGACGSCRRSKVKCEHNGSPPCKRCKNGDYECTFKPREMGSAFLHDEWRIKTDETLNKLVRAINVLVQQETTRTVRKRKRTGDGTSDDNLQPDPVSRVASIQPGHHPTPTASGPHNDGAHNESRRQSTIGWSDLRNSPISLTPHIEGYLGIASRSLSSAGIAHADFRAFQEAVPVPEHFSTNVIGNGVASANLKLEDLTARNSPSHPIRTALLARGGLPLPCTVQPASTFSRNVMSNQPLLARVSRYRFPDAGLGSNDPRLDAIRLGLLSAHEARSLFSLYAKSMEPFGFGFPDFAATAELAPVLISSIASVTSLHSPPAHLRALCLRLRADFLERILPYVPFSAEDEFNRESGIGTEEVIGACIWACYEGGEEAWKVARAARWWSEMYSYASGPRDGLTVGEMSAILPLVKEVGMQDRVRIWLSAFTTELHQCEIHRKDPIMELEDPFPYSQALLMDRNTMTKQDAGLVFYAQMAYLVAKTRRIDAVNEHVEVMDEITASWCSTRALCATAPDGKDTYDHTIDLHYMLAKASILIRACQMLGNQEDENAQQLGLGERSTVLVRISQDARNACMDATRLLLAPKAGFSSNMAALPSIYHFWISKCLAFLVQLCRPEGLHYQLGLLAANQMDEILRTVGTLVQDYISRLTACNASIVIEDHGGEGPTYEVIKHPATDAAMAIADMLAGVQAIA